MMTKEFIETAGILFICCILLFSFMKLYLKSKNDKTPES